MKKEIRVLGVDDSPFEKTQKEVLVVGTLFRGGSWLDGVLSTYIEKDGDDSTTKLTELINSSKFKPQIQAIMVDGIAFGGFNIIDIEKLNQETGIPVIVIVRREPDIDLIERTLDKINMTDKKKLIQKAGKPVKVNEVFVQFTGTTKEKVQELINITCTRSYIPEPVRVAHLISAGVIKGESRGDP